MPERRAEYYRRRGKWVKVVDLRNNCTVVFVKLAHGPWQWELWKWEDDGYSFVALEYAPTLAQALKEARAVARRMKGK